MLGPSANGRKSPRLMEPFRLLKTCTPDQCDDTLLLEYCSLDLSVLNNDGWVCVSNQIRSTNFSSILSQNPGFGVSYIRAKGHYLQREPVLLLYLLIECFIIGAK